MPNLEGKKSAERVGGYTRRDGTKVRSHTRRAQLIRSKEAWIATGFSTLSAVAIVIEAGVTVVSTISIVLIAALSWLAVIASAYATENKKKLGTQRATRKRRRTTRNRTRRTTRK